MKIDASQVFPEGMGLQRTSTTGGASASQGSAGKAGISSDQVKLSADGEAIQQLTGNLDGLPDVRQDRVAALTQAISQGSYQVSGRQIAQAMSSDLLGSAE
jgi:flagellar biosynthesis anti-sigma factor FlgM